MGGATPNPRTCHLLPHRDGLLILIYPPLKARAGNRHSASCRKNSAKRARQHLILGPLGLRNPASLFPGKGIFGPRRICGGTSIPRALAGVFMGFLCHLQTDDANRPSQPASRSTWDIAKAQGGGRVQGAFGFPLMLLESAN